MDPAHIKLYSDAMHFVKHMFAKFISGQLQGIKWLNLKSFRGLRPPPPGPPTGLGVLPLDPTRIKLRGKSLSWPQSKITVHATEGERGAISTLAPGAVIPRYATDDIL